MSIVDSSEDFEQSEILAYLVSSETLQGAALGIARQVLDKGTLSLSPKQQRIFDTVVEPYFKQECDLCGCLIPTSEVVDALSEDGLCSYCRHVLSKD